MTAPTLTIAQLRPIVERAMEKRRDGLTGRSARAGLNTPIHQSISRRTLYLPSEQIVFCTQAADDASIRPAAGSASGRSRGWRVRR